MARAKVQLRRIMLSAGALLLLYIALCTYPQPLFAHSIQRGAVVVHATKPIPHAMTIIVDRARERLRGSSLYDESASTHVFYCDEQWIFAFFTRSNFAAGGVATALGENVFIRRGDLNDDRMIGYSGTRTPPDRPFSYFLAHELMHIAHIRHLGPIRYLSTPSWIDEGYADYVARDIDLTRAHQGFKSGTPALNPSESGLYTRYHLMVAYVLERERSSPSTLLQRTDNGGDVEFALNKLDAWHPESP